MAARWLGAVVALAAVGACGTTVSRGRQARLVSRSAEMDAALGRAERAAMEGDLERAHAVERVDPDPGLRRRYLLLDALELALCHRAVSLVLEERDGATVVVVTHDPEEGRDPAGPGVAHGSDGFIERERDATDPQRAVSRRLVPSRRTP